MTVFYSQQIDKFAESKSIRIVGAYRKVTDWKEVTKEKADLFYYGTTTMPEGKRRKAGTLELEDIPQSTSDELFAKEMDALNANYDKAMSLLANEYNVAIARDASVETEKVLSVRAKITELDSQYESDQLAIINKYFGA